MDYVYIEELGRYVGKEVELRGWVHHRRSSGKLHFLVIRDGTGMAQCVVFKGEVSGDIFEMADRISLESSVMVKGTVREDQRSPGGFEIGVKDLKLVQMSEEYPIQPKEHGVDFLLTHRHLWLRSPKQTALMRIRDEVIKSCRNFLDQRGFIMLDAPIFTPAACEGTSTLFQTDYFGTPAFLTQSGQLYMEAGAFALGRVYCFGPCFRAEKSKTRRHLTEFWMLEPEAAWYHLSDMMDLAEDLVVYIVERALEKRRNELMTLERDISKLELVRKPFARITYDEALKILEQKGKPLEWGQDLGGDEETVMSQSFDQPVIIHHYPAEIKAFYMARDEQRPELALGVDILAPEGYGEIVGGGEREWRYEELVKRIEENDLPKEAFEWYLDLRRFGSVPHSGFGLGLERTVAWICGIHHIRETIPFPRMLERIYP